jgi:hypothetical protein
MYNVSVEQEVRAYFEHARIHYSDDTTSFKKPDFTFRVAKKALFFLEVKEKLQPYNPRNWPAFAPEAELFILDDLTVRKCIAYAPRAGVLVRDNTQGNYRFFSVVDLTLMPKMRVNRAIQRQRLEWKGKWLINLQNGAAAASLGQAFAHIRRYADDLSSILFERHACFGNYIGEQIGNGGTMRGPAYWDADVQATR